MFKLFHMEEWWKKTIREASSTIKKCIKFCTTQFFRKIGLLEKMFACELKLQKKSVLKEDQRLKVEVYKIPSTFPNKGIWCRV